MTGRTPIPNSTDKLVPYTTLFRSHAHGRAPSGGLSLDPRLLDLAGWQVGPLRFGLRLSRNAFTDRSPDPYELDSPAEFVAVNLEYLDRKSTRLNSSP